MRSRVILIVGGLVLLLALLIGQLTTAQASIWRDTSAPAARAGETLDRVIVPDQARVVAADIAALDAILASAPHEDDVPVTQSPVQLQLPMPDGSFMSFRIVESPIMHPDLAARYPEIKTYLAQGIDDPIMRGRFDRTPNGFHAMISTSRDEIYIDPYSRDDIAFYNVYFANDFQRSSAQILPQLPPEILREAGQAGVSQRSDVTASRSGTTRSDYSLALATTGEYSTFHGGTKPLVMSELTTAINRVNEIYERDLAVRLFFVANNDDLIYLNGATDPYTNSSGGAMLSENQITIDAVIGVDQYDVGHVFSTGGGGIATLASVCWTNFAARGVTGLPNPVGDPFYIDFVAHELGHQFGARHTFNSNSGNCAGNQHSPSTAYEPGSGTTIMAYAGICSPHNVQFLSDAMFHRVSHAEIRAYVENANPDFGGECPTLIPTGNTPPTADAGTSGVTLPIDTPFELTGSATDPDPGDVLTYSWEQYDLGPQGAPNSPSGNAPIFRTFLPKSTPVRTFPQISDIVNNTQTLGEILPTYSRDLTFQLTVRDRGIGTGGYDEDLISMSVTNQAGPFAVTSPNGGGTFNNTILVQWNVASTNLNPVSCSTVDILLSTDGGFTYPITMMSGTPNDGSQVVDIPLAGAFQNQARIRVECELNSTVAFFDISNANFATGTPSTQPGDCNASGSINASDLGAVRSEIFDGDGTNPANVGGGSFVGDPVGCDANEDGIIDGGDLSCTALLIAAGTCTQVP